MSDKMRWITVLSLLVVLAAAGWLYLANRTPAAPTAAPLLSSHLVDLAGIRQPLRQWSGQVLVINFWASWCVPCQQQMDQIRLWHTDPSARQVEVISIALDDRAAVQRFVTSHHIDWPVLFGDVETFNSMRQLGDHKDSLPFAAVIGADGRILATRSGAIDRSWLQAHVPIVTHQR
ncbi:MAG: redoxin family protein [Betaproteobacteria bacterium]|nr:redoxin family protein [Betaproteobacteria bacterium]